MQDNELIGRQIGHGVGSAFIVRELDQNRWLNLRSEIFDNRPHFSAGQALFGEVHQERDRCQ